MKVVALISGGKDSCYSMQLCKAHGHDIVALANLLPEESAPDELDSFCFQTVGHQLVGTYAACMGLPLFRKPISGTSSVQDLGYTPTDGDEVEDLYQLLAYVKENVPGVQAVATGAIASDYQRLRVENVCSRLNLVSLAYLWHQPQRVLLRGMVESGLEAILVKVACLGLQPRKHLGRTIAALEPHLLSLADAYGCNVCGEGGEYETLTLDCAVFSRGRIELDEYEIELGTSDVGHLVPKAFRVVPKPGWEAGELPADVRMVPHDYVAAPRHAAPPLAPAAASAAGSAAGEALLLPASDPSSFDVQASLCTGPDYVQLVCRAVRSKSALASDVTECDTTAALHTLLVAAEQELAALHMDLHHCLFVHLFLANMGHFQAANGVYCRHFPGRDPPSRACVQVCLPHDCPVMCEFLLARGSAPLLSPPPPAPAPPPVPRHSRRVLHVQSISSWAPSCIGPYSQATSYRGLVYMAGVIPLDPPTMTLVPGDITAQVLRAMASCEAVAVATRTTVTGAALGLTVYLAAAVGGGGGGGGCGSCGDRGCGSGGGAELRALARSAVEALLEHGMPSNPQPSPQQLQRQNGCPPSAIPGRPHYRRSSTTDSAGGATTPRGGGGGGPFARLSAASAGGLSAPGSRRAVMLGADGLDEEEEEAEQAAAAAGGGGCSFTSSRASATVLDPYLQPPEVRCSARPSVLYVSVPSLPRGSLVEVQPVCLDVEALAVIRRLLGHDSFARRRNASHADTTALHQAHAQGGQHSAHQHQAAGAHAGPHAHAESPCSGLAFGGAGAGVGVGVTTWSELPPTPRASMDSALTSREGAGSREGTSSSSGASAAGLPTHGPAAMAWAIPGEAMAMPLPVHVLSAAGFMSPDAGSLAGTPSASAGPSMLLCRRRSSQLGLFNGGGTSGGGAAGGGGGGPYSRSSSSLVSPQQPQAQHLLPPPSAHASGHQLLSPAHQQSAPSQQQQQQLLGDPQRPRPNALPAVPVPMPAARPRVSSCGGTGSGSSGRDGAVAAAMAAGVASSAPRVSYSGSSGSSGNSGPLPLPHRSSLDGNILSFEVSSGRGPSAHGLIAAPPTPQSVASAVMSPLPSALPYQSGGAGTGTSPGLAGRHRPAAITVPSSSAAVATPIRPSLLENGLCSGAAPASAAGGAYGAAQAHAAGPVSAASAIGVAGMQRNRSLGGSPLPGGSPVAPPPEAAAPAPPGAPRGPGGGAGGSSSDVMVTTVCCYGQVLRSLFHLPPAVFGPGVTTAQLTRRFRRAATSVLAAHGMDMSCLIWARVWYEKGSITLTDDEYGYRLSAPPPAGGGGAGSGVGLRVQHALSAGEEVEAPCIGGDDSNGAANGAAGDSNGGGAPAAAAPTAGHASPRPAGWSDGGAAPSGHVQSPHAPKPPVPRHQPASPGPQQAEGGSSHGGCHAGGGRHTPASPAFAAADPTAGQHQHQQHFHVSWVPVQRVATNASPQPATPCVAVLELLAALPSP